MKHTSLEKLDGKSADAKREHIRHMFNRIAPTYDLLNHLLSLGIDKHWRTKTINMMQLDQSSVVLDLACGTGDLSFLAASKKVRTIFSIDPSGAMLRRARLKLQYLEARTYFLESYGEEIPLKNELCSHAMIAFGIRNVQERKRAFAELVRVLKPGGVLAVLEFTPMDKKLISVVFNFYFQKILPFIGGLISREKQAYEYLPESVARFVTAADLTSEAVGAGFVLAQTKKLAFGIATVVLLQKPE